MPETSLVCMSEFSCLLYQHIFLPTLEGCDYSIDDFGYEDETGTVPLAVFPGTESGWTIARVSEWRNKVAMVTGKRWPDLDEIFEWILMEEPALPKGYAWGMANEFDCELCETLDLMSMESELRFDPIGEYWHLNYQTNLSLCHVCEKEWQV